MGTVCRMDSGSRWNDEQPPIGHIISFEVQILRFFYDCLVGIESKLESGLTIDEKRLNGFRQVNRRVGGLRSDRTPPPIFSRLTALVAIVALILSVGVVSTIDRDIADAQGNTNNAPQFGKSNYQFDLAVGSNGTVNPVQIGAVTASDADSGDTLRLCAVGNEDLLYAVDEYHDALYTAVEDSSRNNWVTTQVSDGDNYGHPNDHSSDPKAQNPRGLLWHDCRLYMTSWLWSTNDVQNPSYTTQFWDVDITTGEITSLPVASAFPRSVYGIAPLGGKVYAVALADGFGTSGTTDDQPAALYEIDLTANPISASRVNSNAAADALGIGENAPKGLANHNGTLYVAGGTNDALFSLDTSDGTATRYTVNGNNIEYFNPFDNLDVDIAACDTTNPFSTPCGTDPRGLASHNGKIYMSEVAGHGHLSELHLAGVNKGRAERVATGHVSREKCGFQQTKYDCWLDEPNGIESAPSAPPDYFEVSSAGVITYTGPAVTETGKTFSFRVLATDGKGGEDEAHITVTTKLPEGLTSDRPNISRLAPAVKSLTVSPGDRVRLWVDVYGLQDVLDNSLGDDVTFDWSVSPSGGSFEEVEPSADTDSDADEREIVFTAPSSPGRYVVKASLDSSECDDGDGLFDGCVAEIEVTVRRPSQPAEPTPMPVNPDGEIPSILVDSAGNQYEVFTPEGGGSFDGETFSIVAPSSAVSNGEYIGVRMHAAGTASNLGMTHQRYTLGDNRYAIAVVDAEGNPVASYLLNNPAKICLPLPAELSKNISKVAIVANNPDSTLTVLASTIRITASGTEVCGNVSQLPVSVAVGKLGAPASLPTPTPEPTPEPPETGGASPPATAILWLLLLGAALTTVSAFVMIGSKRT